ncbi:MAG: hypothetical protein ACJ78Q_06515 [Chloroflexia bacterium]
MTREPPIIFTSWTRWADHNQLKNAHLPGVYLLARFDDAETPPSERADPSSGDIVYIGEVVDQSLMGRWQQFHRAAFEGKPGHSAGLRYHEMFGEGGEDDGALYVSAFVPEGLSREMRSLFIRYVAHKLVWEWAREWGGAPVCNV